MARPHHGLRVWQDAIRLVADIYRLTADFPTDERYGLVSQMRRAAISVPSNIAEGAARGTQREFLQFLYIARGSLSELETQLKVASMLGLCQTQTQLESVESLFAVLGGLIKTLRSGTQRSTNPLQAAKAAD
ncbi:four helix bundle protein [Dyella sp. C11]|uniref:four helix bundle protein n=1 Tax=Dyella sp. C11 TaxID=2126991 RepID=UPI000D64368F|nr:four helix bundle protein [Dyella sp. C11]